MVTDPPYGVNYDPAWRNQAGRSINGTTRRIAAGPVIKPIGARAVGKVVNDDRADWREAWALFPGSVAYIWHAGTKAGIVQDSLAACGFETRSQIIWAKNNFAIGRGHYQVVQHKLHEGTRLGRQELNAEILDDVPGALWSRALIEETRWPAIEISRTWCAPAQGRSHCRGGQQRRRYGGGHD